MIVKKSPPNLYGDYFLAFEADDDQEQQEVRSNMKRINIRSSNRNRVDFTDGADEAPTEDTQSEAENQDASTDAPEDDTSPDTSGNDENFNDDSPDEGNQQEENQDNAENQPEENQEGETSDEDQGGDEPDTSGDDENFSDDSEGGDSSNKTFDDVNDGDQNNQQNNNNGPGLEYDSMRQYKLFIDYKELSESIKKYISNLETEIRDDSEIMKIYRDSIDKFRKINELLCDYMTLKFTASTYIQNLLFYQKMYTATELIIESLLKTIKNNN